MQQKLGKKGQLGKKSDRPNIQVSQLLSTYNDQAKDNTARLVQKIPVDSIVPCRYQPRQKFNDESLNELANSLKSSNLMQPIKVRNNPEGEGYELIFGERRWRAAQILGWDDIPAIIATGLIEVDIMIESLSENTQRENLTEIEKARAIIRIKQQFPDMPLEEIGKKMGYSKGRIAQFLKISSLPVELLDKLEIVKNLGERHIRALVKLNNMGSTLIGQLADEIINKELTGEESLARAKQLMKSRNRKKNTNLSSILERLNTRLDKVENEWKDMNNNRKQLYRDELKQLVNRVLVILEFEEGAGEKNTNPVE